MLWWLRAALVLMQSSALLLAEDRGGKEGIPSVNAGVYGGQGLVYVFALLLLLGAAVVVLNRGGWFGGIRSGGKAVRKLQIEETRMLGHRQYLVVAEYEGRRMMLGVCPGRIDYLCPLDPIEHEEAGGLGGAARFPNITPEGNA